MGMAGHTFQTLQPSNIFMRLMNLVLKPFIGHFIVIYFDGILIYNISETDHLHHLREVLQTFRANKLYLNLQKCEFLQPQLLFLVLLSMQIV